MGQFKIEVTATGGHGCQRELKDSSIVGQCDSPICPDCIARRFVEQLKGTGALVEMARLTHWPGTDSEVIDNLLSGLRKGSF
jgi:hypothetical protein